MAQYRKKPVVIEACQLPAAGDNDWRDFHLWCDEVNFWGDQWRQVGDAILVETREGTMRGNPGDWIIRGVAGEFYPCKNEIFEKTYEAA